MNQKKPKLVELNDLGIRRSGRWLVRHVDMDVHAGEIITIVGPNGSGKSTTLKALVGIERPSEGKVVRHGKPVIGYVPQNLQLNGTMPMTVHRLMRLTGKFKTQEILKALQQFQIEQLEHAQIQNLSGGELQRVLIARATLGDPDLLVLDEPSQGVDFTGQTEIYRYIQDYRDRTGAGVVLVSHDLHLVMAATDRVICMNGHVCCSGAPETIARNPSYLELFGPGTAEAIAIYRHSHDHVHLPDGTVQHADGSITDDCHPGDGHHHKH